MWVTFQDQNENMTAGLAPLLRHRILVIYNSHHYRKPIDSVLTQALSSVGSEPQVNPAQWLSSWFLTKSVISNFFFLQRSRLYLCFHLLGQLCCFLEDALSSMSWTILPKFSSMYLWSHVWYKGLQSILNWPLYIVINSDKDYWKASRSNRFL